jgi:hypothetical protein
MTNASLIRIPMTYPLNQLLNIKNVLYTYKSKDDPWLHEP